MVLLTSSVLSLSITWPIILRSHWSMPCSWRIPLGNHKYVNVHRYQLLIFNKINNGESMTVTVLQRKASTQQIGLLLVPAMKWAVYINTHSNYSQLELTKLYSENIGGHPYIFKLTVAHLVTFSESQWNQFHPRAKKPIYTASWGFPWPPQLLCPWTPLGNPLHTPRHVPLVSHLLQNSTRTNSQNDHLTITFVAKHYICNKCNNEVNFF